jgi:8-oxo-dGTP pyrophosphatase MutT (NUDIX family)
LLRRRLRDVTRLERLFDRLGHRAPRQVLDAGRREAAVALLLLPDPDRILLIRRALREGDPWSGQIALPGGRREPGDADLLHTAIRETFEETGVTLPAARLAATLDDLAPTTPVLPPIVVRPFAFHLDHEPAIMVNAEVAEAVWVPLTQLSDPAIRRPAELTVAGAQRVVTGYHLPAGLLWGMTERILAPVLATWRALGD